MTRHKVVLVPFPFDDLSSSKVRPAVCLTDPVGPHHHIVVAFITSRVPDSLLATDLVIDSETAGFARTGLHVSSTLQVHRMLTLAADIIRRELGVLSPAMQAQVNDRIRVLFGLSGNRPNKVG